LLMISIQEQPAGSIPDDVGVIRRWLGLPSGQQDADRTWARVRPQIFAAWQQRDGRWFNPGMVSTIERAEKYKVRYETGTKKPRDSMKYEDCSDLGSLKEESKPGEQCDLEAATQQLFMGLGVAGLRNRVTCEQAIKALMHDRKCNAPEAAAALLESWGRYQAAPIKYRTHVIGFLEKAVWKQEDTWTQSKSENSMGGW